MINGSVLDLAGWGYWVIASPFIVMGVAFALLVIITGIWAFRGFRGS